MAKYLNITGYSEFSILLTERIGLEGNSIGLQSIERAVNSSMIKSEICDLSEYYLYIKSDINAFQRLVEEIVVPETWFFRDKEPFSCLQKIAEKAFVKSNTANPFRILSAPCSTGEEAYSIAITMLESGYNYDSFVIDAVDISETALGIAKKAVFGRNSFRNDFSKNRFKYFREIEAGWELEERVRSRVRFSQENLVEESFSAGKRRYDVVFCKNLLIYLSDTARKKVLSNIDNLLTDKGTLFTGHSEMLFFLQYGFESVNFPRAFACVREKDKPTVVKKTLPMREKGLKFVNSIKPLKNGTENAVIRQKLIQPALSDGRALNANYEKKSSEAIKDKVEYNSRIALIQSLADSGQLTEALNLCNQLLAENSANDEAYYLAGLLSEASGLADNAENYYNKALYLNPNHSKSLVHLSLIFESKGNEKQAKLLMERANRTAFKKEEY